MIQQESFSQGPGFITNFSPEDQPAYVAAIAAAGLTGQLEIRMNAYAMNGRYLPDSRSLHAVGCRAGDLSEFWRIHGFIQMQRRPKPWWMKD